MIAPPGTPRPAQIAKAPSAEERLAMRRAALAKAAKPRSYKRAQKATPGLVAVATPQKERKK